MAKAQVSAPTPGPSVNPYQQVAPMTPQQLEAIQTTQNISPGTQDFLTNAMGTENQFASGSLLDPTNPYLAAYFNSAAQPMTQAFQQTTAPGILQNAAQTGTLGSAGQAQAYGNAENALAQGLGNLSAGIYEPAYAQGLTATQDAISNAPSLASGQYVPSQTLMQMGQVGQSQAQNILNTGYGNLYNTAQAPYQELAQLGQGLGLASGGGSQGGQVTTQPYAGSGK